MKTPLNLEVVHGMPTLGDLSKTLAVFMDHIQTSFPKMLNADDMSLATYYSIEVFRTLLHSFVEGEDGIEELSYHLIDEIERRFNHRDIPLFAANARQMLASSKAAHEAAEGEK